jgi:hypothetical protein
MKKFLTVAMGMFFPLSSYAIDGQVDIDSWSILIGQVTQSTCLYADASANSTCLDRLDKFSVLNAGQATKKGKFTRTNTIEMNPNYQCDFNNYSSYGVTCTGGEPYFVTWGYVWSDYFEIVRKRQSCDGVQNLYLTSPSISCDSNSCEVDVSFSSAPQVDMRVEVEIDTYDKKGKRIGSEDEDETSYYGYSVEVDFDYLDKEVSRVVVTDINCEKW